MQSRHSAASGPSVRPANKLLLKLAKHRRIPLAILMTLVIAMAGTTGYMLGNSKPAEAAVVVDDADCVAAFTDQLAAENDLCSQIEQLNLQVQLNEAQEKTAELENTLDAQQEEMDSLTETILGALMANLTDLSVSRSGKTVNAYREEAQNLIELNYKLNQFKKTDAADEIDLTTYEAAIDKRLDYIPTIKPIPGVYDGYGYRRHPITRQYHFHPASDVSADKGDRIKAAAAGTVTASTYDSSRGYYITIDHKNGFTTTYMHCSKLYVSAGEKVTKGELIALVGSTGSSTGPHLHYEVTFYGEPVNPTRIIME